MVIQSFQYTHFNSQRVENGACKFNKLDSKKMNCRYKIQQLGSQKINNKEKIQKNWRNSNSVVSFDQNHESKWKRNGL